jgi:predicted kinase
MIDEARACLALGSQFLAPAPARMVAIGGLSGTGKSTVARLTAPALGRAPGAAVLRSDVIRKRQAGLDAAARLGPQAYTPAAAAAVYGEMIDMAGRAVRAGQSAIVDAVFALHQERDAVAAAARAAGVPFTGIWLEAPAGQLKARIAARRGDASDATVDVLQRQLEYDLGAIAWRRIDASDTPEAVAARLAALLDASRG